MKNKLALFIILSLVFHSLLLLGAYWLNGLSGERAFGEEYAVISVDIASEPIPASNVRKKSSRGDMKSKTSQAKVSAKSSKKDGTGSVGKVGTPGAGGGDNTLTKIRAKIERAKRYPRSAKRMKIEGRPRILFQINSDGSVKYVKLTESSGQQVLDNAAVETVKTAAPYPFYSQPINLAIRYELNQ